MKLIVMKLGVTLAALAMSTTALAVCYQIFASDNTLVWQKTTPPVRMDAPSVADEVRKLVPGGHLVIVEDRSAPCPTIDTIKHADETVTPRKKRRKSR